MIKTNYANAYKEVLIVLNNLVKEDYEKIPKEYIEFLESNANHDYNLKYDKSKSFEEQELLLETKYILFGLFEKFWATETQKSKIIAFKNSYNEQLEKDKRQKYNSDNLFKKQEKETDEKIKKVSMIEYKKNNIFERIKNFIMKILRIG